jgi:cell division protein FtsX
VERKAGSTDEYERVKRTKFKLYPKEAALDKMAKHLGIKGFSNPLTAKVGVKMQSNPDGTFEAAVLLQLSDEELERIAAGIDDDIEEERTE